MTDGEYNGWPNRETWTVRIHLDDDTWEEHARALEQTREELAETLKESIKRGCPPMQNGGVFSDLMDCAYSKVDWNRLAQSILDEVEAQKSAG
jgi:methionyl-tRNA formyltransferase